MLLTLKSGVPHRRQAKHNMPQPWKVANINWISNLNTKLHQLRKFCSVGDKYQLWQCVRPSYSQQQLSLLCQVELTQDLFQTFSPALAQKFYCVELCGNLGRVLKYLIRPMRSSLICFVKNIKNFLPPTIFSFFKTSMGWTGELFETTNQKYFHSL